MRKFNMSTLHENGVHVTIIASSKSLSFRMQRADSVLVAIATHPHTHTHYTHNRICTTQLPFSLWIWQGSLHVLDVVGCPQRLYSIKRTQIHSHTRARSTTFTLCLGKRQFFPRLHNFHQPVTLFRLSSVFCCRRCCVWRWQWQTEMAKAVYIATEKE